MEFVCVPIFATHTCGCSSRWPWSVMTLERKVHVPAYDVLAVRSLWEVRVKKQQQRQRKEHERKERSALAKIEQQWQYRIYCKTASPPRTHPGTHAGDGEVDVSSFLPAERPCGEDPDASDDKKLVFQLDGRQWKVSELASQLKIAGDEACSRQDFPRELQWMTYLREWHVTGTQIQKLPDYLSSFTLLAVLDLPKNALTELPPDIGEMRLVVFLGVPAFNQAPFPGKLVALRELNVSFNRLRGVPAQLGDCQNLERLELAGNANLCQLPFELSALKKLRHLDVAQNNMASIPICALRMSNLQLLDLSHNRLSDLPQDMDRLQQLQTLLVHKNKLTYIPQCLANISTLSMMVVSGEELVCIPTRLCSNPSIKFIRLYDSPASDKKEEEIHERGRGRGRWRE
uniref:leucine-rich repeat-containing protein 2 n=1 Tax=Doryrhamphus excisus TaxID=161450 RepID=UPI0025AEC523|nr:leucine-rich repeat-containing protein 2 [Doryrhamphus excisus]